MKHNHVDSTEAPMILAYSELCQLVEKGVIRNTSISHVNAASIDVHLGRDFLVEDVPTLVQDYPTIDLMKRESLNFKPVNIRAGGHMLMDPGSFLLAHTIEMFYLPNNISAEFVLKSTIARGGLNQLDATWCNAGWSNSTMTLELQNVTRYHRLKLTEGMGIGQIVFHRHTKVPEAQLYSTRGSYNNHAAVMPASV